MSTKHKKHMEAVQGTFQGARKHIPPFTGSSETHRLKSAGWKGICDRSQDGSIFVAFNPPQHPPEQRKSKVDGYYGLHYVFSYYPNSKRLPLRNAAQIFAL